MFLPHSEKIHWTYHARAKMAFYKLSEQRVLRVLHSPKRIEGGIAPKTVAVMQPASLKFISNKDAVPAKAGTHVGFRRQETWNQEIWVMFQTKRQGTGGRRQEITNIISAWRYPGKTKPRSEAVIDGIKAAYEEYMKSQEK